MKVLVVGSGGREHALCWAIAKSAKLSKLYCAPGNAGIADVAECVAVGAEDVDAVVSFAKENAIDLVVVGPEAPLVLGMVDKLEEAGIKAFGPSAAASVLEGSKGFMKDMCAKAGVPTAGYGRFTDAAKAKEFIRENGAPIVVKTDGLAAGKGVIICQSVEEAEKAVDDMMGDKIFGDAGNEIVIEDFLRGEECSFFALVDGERALPLAAAQDHKAAYDGDRGPNTGGMGAYSPAPIASPEICDKIMETAINPLIKTMADEGCPYKGVLFCGLMVEDGVPTVLEYNIRFGDPECQVLMMRWKSDVLEALDAAAEGRLDDITLEWHDETAMVVVMAAEGYPGSYEKGTEIKNLAEANGVENAFVFHAGTKAEDDKVLATGGRVLGVTGRGTSVSEAQATTYKAVDAIDWPKGFCRRDIGWRAVEREKS
ncbi:phosphoribosylamine--glycine ligase [Terasakiella sp. SH-1]|uniref:phosphoribosylamine--glycine ligase n=1 Tax=Terasakiella sp. SH-1 TaxID=2560057 RepID=UPI00107420D7|nr:phosphoribosylamine--glycine ligase [Terasakiella sp. SH-1]